jgi:hypothetical protein
MALESTQPQAPATLRASTDLYMDNFTYSGCHFNRKLERSTPGTKNKTSVQIILEQYVKPARQNAATSVGGGKWAYCFPGLLTDSEKYVICG